MLLYLKASSLFTCRIVLLKQKNCLSFENTLLLLQSFIKTAPQHLLSGVKKHCGEIKKRIRKNNLQYANCQVKDCDVFLVTRNLFLVFCDFNLMYESFTRYTWLKLVSLLQMAKMQKCHIYSRRNNYQHLICSIFTNQYICNIEIEA